MDDVKTVRVIMKSGTEFMIKCEYFRATKTNGILTEYEIDGVSGDYPLHISTPDVAAIIQVIHEAVTTDE